MEITSAVVAAGMIALATTMEEKGKITGLSILSPRPKNNVLPKSPIDVFQDAEGNINAIDSIRSQARGILKPAKEICYEELPTNQSETLLPEYHHPSPNSGSSFMPKEPRVRFSDNIALLDAYPTAFYDRSSCVPLGTTRDTALDLEKKRELNKLKAEMEVHEESRHNTCFYNI
jgi:hypothetical protein